MKQVSVNFLSAFLLFASLLSSCSTKKDEVDSKAAAAKPKGVVADAYVVKTMPFSNSFTASGSLLANEVVTLQPEVGGRITSINFTEGSTVRKGQLLIQLFDADVRANIQKLRAQRGLQHTTAGRQSELLKIGGIAKQDYDATITGIAGIDADIAAANATLSKMHMLAPFDGTIGIRNVSVGAVVSPTTVVATLQQLNPLKMDFAVPDQYRNQIHNGQVVRFSVDGRSDTLSGKVSAIEPGADASTRTIHIHALVENTKRALSPGIFAHITVPLETNAATIFIPSQAIIPTTRDKKVAVVKRGKAQLVTVQTGVRTADRIEITGGLNPGDTILTTALMQVKPNMDVKVRKVMP